MTLKQERILSAISVGVSVIGGLEALLYILNLNQAVVFIHLSFWIYLFLITEITFLYDLHFKNPGSLQRARAKHENVATWFVRSWKIFLSVFWDRLRHLGKWDFFRHFQNYLVLPSLIFWSTVALLYLNFGKVQYQQVFTLLSSAALIVNYWYLKEIFSRKKDVVDEDIFIALSSVKLYAAFLVFSASLGLTRHFCLPYKFLFAAAFAVCALLIFQALFQHNKVDPKTMLHAVLISAGLALTGTIANSLWSYNYFTFGAFMMATYNFSWGLYHHKIDKTLNQKTFWELFLVSAFIIFMLISITNFHEKLINAC